MLLTNTHFVIRNEILSTKDLQGFIHTKEEWRTYFVQEILEVDRWKEATKHRNSAGQNRAYAIHIPVMEKSET